MRRFGLLTVVAALLGAGLAPAQDARKLPRDLELVPGESYGFFHVKLADLGKSPVFGSYRQALASAGPKALAAFDAQYTPAPSTTDRVTVAFVPRNGPGSEPLPLVVLKFSQKFDAQRVARTYAPDAKPQEIAGRSFYPVQPELYMTTVDDQLILLGPVQALQLALVKRDPAAPLMAKLQEAADPQTMLYSTASAKLIPLPPDFDKDIPEQFRPLARVEELTLRASLTEKLSIRLDAKYPNAERATAANQVILDLAKMGRMQLEQYRKEAEKAVYAKPLADRGKPLESLPETLAQLAAVAGLKDLDALLDRLPIERKGDTLTASAEFAADQATTPVVVAMGIGLLLPAVQKVREAAARAQSQNNLKQIGLAMHNYESAYQTFPAAAITGKDGKPLLSWRVAVLPFIDQDALYKQFKLDEPWDSEHNAKLIPQMPKVYAHPGAPLVEGQTFYKVFVGKNAVFNDKKGMKIIAVTDGTSNTILATDGGPPVVWTKPEDIEFDGKTVPNLTPPGPVLQLLMADGSVRAVRLEALDPKTILNLINPNDGNVVNFPND